MAEKEVLINSVPSNIIQRRQMVDLNEAGDILVTWIENQNGTFNEDVFVKKYNASTQHGNGVGKYDLIVT